MIAEAEEKDIPEITVLIEQAIKTCIDVTEKQAGDLVARCIENIGWWQRHPAHAIHYVYRVDDRVAGVVLVKEYWNLVSLFVDPDYQARGIGRQLVLKALELCCDKSPKGMVSLCSSTHAKGFYQAIGFRQTGEPKHLPGGCIPFCYEFDRGRMHVDYQEI